MYRIIFAVILSNFSFAYSQGSYESFFSLCIQHKGTVSNCRDYAQREVCKSNGGRWLNNRCANPLKTDKHDNKIIYGNDSEDLTTSLKSPPKGTQPPQKQTDSFSQCESAYKKTQVTCNGQTIAPAVTALLNSVAQMKSSGNMKAACESAKKVSA